MKMDEESKRAVELLLAMGATPRLKNRIHNELLRWDGVRVQPEEFESIRRDLTARFPSMDFRVRQRRGGFGIFIAYAPVGTDAWLEYSV